MPRRSNSFQKLILLIEEQLAPVGAIISESVLLPETLTGDLREVDIVIRYAIGAREVVIGIECRDHKRKADVQWVEQVRSKFDVLRIDRRVVISRSGFTKRALMRAAHWNIEAISLDQAIVADWAAPLTQVSDQAIGRTRFRIIAVRLSCQAPPGIAGRAPAKPIQFLFNGIEESADDFGRRLIGLNDVQRIFRSNFGQHRGWES